MKKQSDLSRLMGYAGNYRAFTYASWVLSAVSALVALVPFVYIWKILRDVLNAAPDYAQAVNIPHYGWMAVSFAVLSYLIYIAALMCSHLSAFRVATNLRLAVSEHLAVLPLGFAENFGSGKLRKIIHESTGATETYLAHQLPDQYNAIATPVGLLVLLLAFDWRLGLLSLAPVVLAFLIMATMTGKGMAEKMRQYGNALEAMSNEAVEYVRGIPVVKTFGQSVFSFKKFKTAIDEYEKWGHLLHQRPAPAHDVLHRRRQRRVRFSDRGRTAVHDPRRHPGVSAEPAVLYHHHAGDLPDVDPYDVYEREQDGGSGCAGTHRLGAGGGAHAGAGCSAAPEEFLCHVAGCAFQLRRKNRGHQGRFAGHSAGTDRSFCRTLWWRQSWQAARNLPKSCRTSGTPTSARMAALFPAASVSAFPSPALF